ncbi:type VII secretion protein EccB [Streptomyces sp. NPDC059441]|uniref:type VII secretion protein EccB n=1 Tax=Streptomyces sp. NPDC059441 TaxID=3346829 RepID=UPI0036B59637
MQNRRDQVQAHQFVVGRLTAGLLRADPDDPETPLRRTNRGVMIGAVLGVVLCVGFLAYGFIRPGGATSWRDGRSLVVEKSTGNRYLFDGHLRPVRNYASARLILGADMSTTTVTAASLAGTAHGAAVGIDGAPDDLPGGDSIGPKPWEVCVGTEATASGGRSVVTSLLVASDSPGFLVSGDKAVVVSYRTDDYLVWRGNRFRFVGGTKAMDALGYSAVEPVAVSAAFLDALPAGADLAPPPVAHQGSDGPVLDGVRSKVGQVFVVHTPGGTRQQYYLVGDEGLVPVTTTQAALSLVRTDVRGKAYGGRAPSALPLSADALSRAPVARGLTGEDGSVRKAAASLPPSPPAIQQTGALEHLCARLVPQGSRGTAVGLVVADAAAIRSRTQAPAPAKVPPCVSVDGISVPPSGGSYVRALSSSGNDVGSTTYLVTDTGVKYRVANSDSAVALGYDPANAESLPTSLLDMLPTGPDLSTTAAKSGISEVTDRTRCDKASAH